MIFKIICEGIIRKSFSRLQADLNSFIFQHSIVIAFVLIFAELFFNILCRLGLFISLLLLPDGFQLLTPLFFIFLFFCLLLLIISIGVGGRGLNRQFLHFFFD